MRRQSNLSTRKSFVVLNTCDYVEKVEHQINRSSFGRLDEDPSPEL